MFKILMGRDRLAPCEPLAWHKPCLMGGVGPFQADDRTLIPQKSIRSTHRPLYIFLKKICRLI